MVKYGNYYCNKTVVNFLGDVKKKGKYGTFKIHE